MKPVVTRFAPSPTGFMHIGGVRTALFAYLYARQQQGTFILRIEDTDKAREVAGSVEHIQESLNYIGLDWDYGPQQSGPFGSCIQSARLDTYKKVAEELVQKGLAYPDPYTTEEVTAFREQASAEKRPFLFRHHRPETFALWDGNMPLRFKVPVVKRYTWHDAVRGKLSAGEEMLDDFIIMKADGYPTYNFAHIVDDNAMAVTHVMRGEEFISSTPKFLSLYDALEYELPVFVTLPPILRDDRTKKLGKRDGAKDLLDYRADGYLGDTMRNFLALIGWNPGTTQEIFSKDELIAAFSLEHIQKGGAVFNDEKLNWMNREYLQTLNKTAFQTYVETALPETVTDLPQYSAERLNRLLPIIQERIHVATEITTAATAGEYDFAFAHPNYEAPMLMWKQDDSVKDTLPRLKKALGLLETADFSTPESIKNAVWEYAETVGRGQLLWPLRIAITGRDRSPDPFMCAYVVGKPETIARIQAACDKIIG